MIVTSRFVILHLHKSGGTFVNQCVMQFLPDARQVGYHLPRSMIPAESAQLPVLGFVRNPWSYYVSWFSFQQQQSHPNFLFRILSDEGRLDFENTVRNMLDLGAGSIRLDLVLRALPSAYSNRGLNLPGFALAPIRNTRLGFYTFLYRYLYGGLGAPVRLGKMESLRHDLPEMLASVGQSVDEKMRDFIVNENPHNASQHARYAEYYSPALRELVAARDAEVIERHRYEFGA